MTRQAYDFSKLLKEKYNQLFPNKWNHQFNCNLSYYSPELANGGSRGKHQDNPGFDLGLVLVYSYGQTRNFSVYKDGKRIHRFPLKENSLLAMRGPSFQTRYFHQLEKLRKNQEAFDRVSFNTRYF
jgi:alkylated DNA repair dioxygenase AlkB